jgi:signal peptidase I
VAVRQAGPRRGLASPPAPPVLLGLTAAGNVILVIGSLFLLGSSTLFAFSRDPGKSFFGFRLYNVLTSSMAPGPDSPPGGFQAGDLIIVQKRDPAALRVGDIVTFATGADHTSQLTHRVVRIERDAPGRPGLWLVTRGDANRSDDPPVPADQVFGRKVLAIPKLGAFVSQTKQHPLAAGVFLVSAAGFVVVLRQCRASSADPAPLGRRACAVST